MDIFQEYFEITPHTKIERFFAWLQTSKALAILTIHSKHNQNPGNNFQSSRNLFRLNLGVCQESVQIHTFPEQKQHSTKPFQEEENIPGGFPENPGSVRAAEMLLHLQLYCFVSIKQLKLVEK